MTAVAGTTADAAAPAAPAPPGQPAGQASVPDAGSRPDDLDDRQCGRADVAPLPLIAIAAVLAGLGLEIFGVRWVTTMHEQIPDVMQSRMFSYDAFGSFLFIPVGQILAGPLQALLGTPGAIWLCAAVIAAAIVAVAFVPGIRAVRAGKATTDPVGPEKHIGDSQPEAV